MTIMTSNDNDTVLQIDDLVVHYILEDETVKAVNGVTLSLKKGQTIGLVGETGAGKTSTALSLWVTVHSERAWYKPYVQWHLTII